MTSSSGDMLQNWKLDPDLLDANNSGNVHKSNQLKQG